MMLTLLLAPGAGWATEQAHSGEKEQMDALLNVGFEDLANMRLTTAARKEQRLVDTAAAVYVIDQEEIRRSGMTSIPELLRLVPGMNVARINSSNWAISARGFNEQYSNKLLVLMDGRTLYDPSYAGVNWDVQDTLLEDVERIEVIRGPGGSLWGANAVNGIVNIITKQAADTQGWLVTGGGGSQEKYRAGIRYGGEVGKEAKFRFYAKRFDQNDFKSAQGRDAGDDWNAGQGGFRLDWHPGEKNKVTLQGDVYNVQETLGNTHNSGGNLLVNWTHNLTHDSQVDMRLYHDRTVRAAYEEREITDLDLQHRFHLSGNQEIIWGVGYRASSDIMRADPVVGWNHLAMSDETLGAFFQDEVTLMAKRLTLTVGSKLEHNDFTAWEIQPNVRLLWRVADDHILWAAVSRAVRTPSRADVDFALRIVAGPASRILLSGNPGFQAEEMVAYEVGYRSQLVPKTFLDMALFYDKYDKLSTKDVSVALAGGVATVNQTFVNRGSGSTYGAETALEWWASETWKLRASHTWLAMDLSLVNGVRDPTLAAEEASAPRQQFQVRSYWNFSRDWEFDVALFHVTRLAALNIPAYDRVDAHLGWQPRKDLQLSLVAHNVLDSQHPEFTGTSVQNSEVARSFFVKATWKY
ncbi:MAG: TonB-dependent receptor [Magnetococcales bacterium]|nr:TonB-dependent receptor [Magnetococcales bacterium]